MSQEEKDWIYNAEPPTYKLDEDGKALQEEVVWHNVFVVRDVVVQIESY